VWAKASALIIDRKSGVSERGANNLLEKIGDCVVLPYLPASLLFGFL